MSKTPDVSKTRRTLNTPRVKASSAAPSISKSSRVTRSLHMSANIPRQNLQMHLARNYIKQQLQSYLNRSSIWNEKIKKLELPESEIVDYTEKFNSFSRTKEKYLNKQQKLKELNSELQRYEQELQQQNEILEKLKQRKHDVIQNHPPISPATSILYKNNTSIFNYQNPSKPFPFLRTGSESSTQSSTSTSSSTSEPLFNPFAATTPLHNSLLSPQNTSESTSTDVSELNKMVYISDDNDEEREERGEKDSNLDINNEIENDDENDDDELVDGVKETTLEEVEEFINSEPKKTTPTKIENKNKFIFDDNEIFNSSRESTPVKTKHKSSTNNNNKPSYSNNNRIKMPSKSPILLLNQKNKDINNMEERERIERIVDNNICFEDIVDNNEILEPPTMKPPQKPQAKQSQSKQQIHSKAKIPKMSNNNKYNNKFIKSPIKIQQPNRKTSSKLSSNNTTNTNTSTNTNTNCTTTNSEIDLGLIESIVISENLNVKVSNEILGEGAFGRVYLGFNTDTGIQVAVKEMKLNDLKNMNKTANSLRKEIKLMKQLTHPNIVQYYGTILIQNSKGLQIIMEYMSGKSVANVLKLYGKLKENVVKKYLKDILNGLIYLHENHVIHRDIKGANILLNERGNAKLGDFGCSTQFSGMQSYASREMLGTVPWMAPEVIRQEEKIGRKSDIWSLGCTVIEMFSGLHPWYTYSNAIQLIRHIGEANDVPQLPPDIDISDSAIDFLNKCNPDDRLCAKDLMKHPFLIM